MKAIQYIKAENIAVNEVDMPQVPKGWALIKVAYAGICGTDLNIYAGTHPRAQSSLIMGHEFSGTVVKDVGDYKAGARVAVYPLISCGKCPACRRGNGHVCNTLGLYGIDKAGGMAEYVAVPEDRLVTLPDGISDKVGAFVEPIAVAVHTLRETGYVPGDNAIIWGCGTIGLCLALTLRKFGVGKLVLAETDAMRRSFAADLGFETINPTEIDIYEEVKVMTNGNGFDWVFDCAGSAQVAKCLLDVVKVKGKIVIVASYKKPTELPLFKGMAKELSIQFVRVYRMEDFEIAAELALKEPLYERIITHVLPLSEAQKGFDLLFTPGTGAIKVMFACQEEN